MVNNPYIEKVKEHHNIINIPEDIYPHKWKWWEYFENSNEIYLEVWTGLGNFFSKEVQKNPNINFIWMEIKYKRLYIWAEKSLWNLNNYSSNGTRLKGALEKAEAHKNSQSTEGFSPLQNSVLLSKRAAGGELWNPNFVLLKDFWENIDEIFVHNEIVKSYIFFPDPWAKKKRRLKNRLLQETFLNNLYSITKSWWVAIIKTDHLEYFEFILVETKKTPWKIVKSSYDWEQEKDFDNNETTEFQQLFRWQDIKINYLELKK